MSCLSRLMALQRGDVISTCMPPGVGLGHNPQVFLKAGDVIGLGSDGLGSQRQTVVPHTDAMGAAWRGGRSPSL